MNEPIGVLLALTITTDLPEKDVMNLLVVFYSTFEENAAIALLIDGSPRRHLRLVFICSVSDGILSKEMFYLAYHSSLPFVY